MISEVTVVTGHASAAACVGGAGLPNGAALSESRLTYQFTEAILLTKWSTARVKRKNYRTTKSWRSLPLAAVITLPMTSLIIRARVTTFPGGVREVEAVTARRFANSIMW